MSRWALGVSVLAAVLTVTVVKAAAGSYVHRAPTWALVAAVVVGCAAIAMLAIYGRRRGRLAAR